MKGSLFLGFLFFLLFLANLVAAGIFLINFFPAVIEHGVFSWFLVAGISFYPVLLGINAIMLFLGRAKAVFVFVSVVGLIKYGLLFLISWNFAPSTDLLLPICALLLILETLFFMHLFVFRLRHVLAAFIWFLFTDLCAFIFGLWANDAKASLLLDIAVVLSIILPFVLAILFSGTTQGAHHAIKAKPSGRWALKR